MEAHEARAEVGRGIGVRIARRGVEGHERLGRWRWVVERTLGWLHRFRRLRIRYEWRADEAVAPEIQMIQEYFRKLYFDPPIRNNSVRR